MRFRFLLLVIGLSAWLAGGARLYAHISTLALTGNNAAGIPAATWNALDSVKLNNAGSVAFAGTLEHQGGISAANDAGIWLLENTSSTLLAQTGSAGVPDVAGANFNAFESLSLSDSGAVAAYSSLASGTGGVSAANQAGIWHFAENDNRRVVRTGAGGVAGLPNANFIGFPTPGVAGNFSMAPNGRLSIFGSLEPGVGGVISSNNFGLWSYGANNSALLSREGSLGVPGLIGVNFQNFLLPAINSNDQVVFLGLMQTGGTVTAANSLGIWRYASTTGELLARSGVGNVPGKPSTNFVQFDSPLINEVGQVAFSAELAEGTAGVWLFGESAGEMVVSATSEVPGVPGAGFAEHELIAINDASQLLVASVLEPGVGGVSSADNQGLWRFGDDDLLVARTGSGNVPGLPTADFAGFGASALNENGQIAFAAELQIGLGGVDSTNDSGIWLADPAGSSWLVARTGDQLAGRTIASLIFTGDDVTQSNGFNDSGQIAFQVSFTNGDSGLFLFRPDASDFDGDGEVGAGDLTMWQAAYSVAANADADLDDDSDGADFLAWQREFGSGAASLPIVSEVPEPAGFSLLALAALGVDGVNRRKWFRR